jgi:hypothetical protein
MTDYVHDLQTALRQAAAREYPHTQPAPSQATGQRRRGGAARSHRRAMAVGLRYARRRHRRAVRLAAVGLAVAAFAFVVANVASNGGRSVVAPAQAQIILRHVRAALRFPPHAIYEEKTVSTVTARDGTRLRTGWQEWLSTSPPYNGRIIERARGKILWEQAFVRGRLDLYDPTTHTIYLAPGVRPHQTADTPQSTSALSEVKYLLAQHHGVQINRNATLRGKPAIKLTFDHNRFTYWISPRTYQPLQAEDRYDSLPNGQPAVGIARIPIVRILTGHHATPRLLSLQAQHPTATIDHNPHDYKAAYRRLIDIKGALK